MKRRMKDIVSVRKLLHGSNGECEIMRGKWREKYGKSNMYSRKCGLCKKMTNMTIETTNDKLTKY